MNNTSTSWPKPIQLRLEKMRKDKMFVDIEVVVGSKTFDAHKTVLCATSDYFAYMFTGSLVEATQSSVTLTGIREDLFEKVMCFMYSFCNEAIAEKLITEDNVEELLQAADMLQIESLKEIVIAHILKNLCEENMFSVYILGYRYNIPVLCNKTAKTISSKFNKIAKDNDFHLMDIHALKAFFMNSHLLASNEDKFCKFILGWFNADLENREQYFDEVMNLFCIHNLEDSKVRYITIEGMYNQRGKKRKHEEACGTNPRCILNGPRPVSSRNELVKVYGERCIILKDRTDLMNTFKCKYSVFSRRMPDEFLKMELRERGIKISFDEQLSRGDHHMVKFYQGQQKSDHCVLIGGNYHWRTYNSVFIGGNIDWETNKITPGYDQGVTLGIFSNLPKVFIIVDSEENKRDNTVNPRYTHRYNKSVDEKRMWRYPYMTVIGGAEVDMDDALRFACSLVVKYSGDCTECNEMGLGRPNCNTYIDIWSPSLEKKRAQHYTLNSY